ncbi:MAG: MEKHLA domain-containing protein [Ignavibacteria bacterium]
MSGIEPAVDNGFLPERARLLLASYRALLGRELLPRAAIGEAARALYHAPFVVLSHDTAADPVFVYANLAAQRLFEMPWCEIVGMPSRFSAEPLARDERQRLLERVARDGYIDDYAGVRIARSGRRFRIAGATVWNVSREDGRLAGQAAAFADWAPLG